MKQCNKLLTIRNIIRFHSGNKFIIYKKINKNYMWKMEKFRDKTNGNYVHVSCSFSTWDFYHFRINKILNKEFSEM